MFEAACEPYNHCDNDQLSFKAYFSRFIAASTKWLPELYDLAQPYLQASAIAAAEQCDGSGAGVEGYACGMKWVDNTTWDGTYGFGQQYDATEIVLTHDDYDCEQSRRWHFDGVCVGRLAEHDILYDIISPWPSLSLRASWDVYNEFMLGYDVNELHGNDVAWSINYGLHAIELCRD
jgi:hypothetical protein